MSKPRSQPPPSAPAPAFDTGLSLEDSGAYARRALADKASPAAGARPAVADGYNPYNVSPDELAAAARAARAKPRSRPKDLRKLSEWIRLRRQLEAGSKDDPESD